MVKKDSKQKEFDMVKIILLQVMKVLLIHLILV